MQYSSRDLTYTWYMLVLEVQNFLIQNIGISDKYVGMPSKLYFRYDPENIFCHYI